MCSEEEFNKKHKVTGDYSEVGKKSLIMIFLNLHLEFTGTHTLEII